MPYFFVVVNIRVRRCLFFSMFSQFYTAPSFKFAFDCRNETGRTLSSIFYDVNGTVVNSDDNHVGQFTTIHPGTSQYLNMYSACAMTGFKSIEGIL